MLLLWFTRGESVPKLTLCSLLNWIGALTLSPMLKLPPRKLQPWFSLWSFFVQRLLAISKIYHTALHGTLFSCLGWCSYNSSQNTLRKIEEINGKFNSWFCSIFFRYSQILISCRKTGYNAMCTLNLLFFLKFPPFLSSKVLVVR